MTELAAKSLPDDIDKLKHLCENKDKRIAHLEQMVRYLKHKQYGKSSERFVAPGQENLFDEAEQLADESGEPLEDQAESIEGKDSEESSTNKAPKKSGRRKLPEDLPRKKIYHELELDEQHCHCGCELKVIDEVISEQLAVIPAEMYVIQHCRKKYVCSGCPEKAPVTAPLPPQTLPKSNASPELLSHIAVSKFLDGLPFYRQEKIWERVDISLPRATMANWMIGCGQLTQSLINLLVEYQYQYNVIHIDETPTQVLNEKDKPPDSKSYFWVTVGGPPDKQVYRYHYNPSRGSAVAQDLLQGFKGTVMSDDWAVYGKVCETLQLTHIACNDHARRQFNDAVKKLPKTRKNKGISKAEMGLNFYRKIYAIERRLKGLSPAEKLATRQKESVPLWEKFIAWMEKCINQVTPSSPLGKALHYTYKLREKLSYYCQNGALPISNEKAENAIRPFAIARKNFLFYNSSKGAEASANLYSLIITAKHHGLNPFFYLAHVFRMLPLANTVEDIEALLPWQITNEKLRADCQVG